MVAGTSPLEDEHLTTFRVWKPKPKPQPRHVPKLQDLLVMVVILGMFFCHTNGNLIIKAPVVPRSRLLS